MGGDHSISIPIARALNDEEDVTVIQLDAHLDWSDAPGGQTLGNGSPMRRMSEMDHINKWCKLVFADLVVAERKTLMLQKNLIVN